MAIRMIPFVLLWFFHGASSNPLNFFIDFNIQETDFKIRGEQFNCTGLPFEFQCNDPDHRCIYSFFFCDTVIDCPNGFDENPFFCTSAWDRICELEERFQMRHGKPWALASCDNSMCITECDICDGQYLDCTDASDEDPAICDTDLRPARVGDCSLYRQP